MRTFKPLGTCWKQIWFVTLINYFVLAHLCKWVRSIVYNSHNYQLNISRWSKLTTVLLSGTVVPSLCACCVSHHKHNGPFNLQNLSGVLRSREVESSVSLADFLSASGCNWPLICTDGFSCYIVVCKFPVCCGVRHLLYMNTNTEETWLQCVM